MYCKKHDLRYDTDYEEECPHCIESFKKELDVYISEDSDE